MLHYNSNAYTIHTFAMKGLFAHCYGYAILFCAVFKLAIVKTWRAKLCTNIIAKRIGFGRNSHPVFINGFAII